MNKITISSAIFMVMHGPVNAALAPNANLTIDTGSSFGMEVQPDFFIDIPITGFNGINIGTAQSASGSHTGFVDGTENPDIDNPWLFYANTGMHQSITPVNILSDDGAGNVALDFSGWGVTWNGVPNINLGSGTSAGAASMTCSTDCSQGDSYTLDYLATVPLNDPSGFGGVNYRVSLTGMVAEASAPLPDTSLLAIDAGANPDLTGQCALGTCFGMEVSPGLWIWTLVDPGNDGGFVVGKNQLSGGQEMSASGTNATAGDISAAWFFFGAYGTFYADNMLNTFSDTSNDGVTALNDFNVAWNGNIIPMGGGSVNNYGITLDGTGGGSWNMDYTTVVPSGQFQGVNFRMLASGSVSTPVNTNNPPVASDVNFTANSGETANWAPDFTDPNAGDTHSCEITASAANGNATVNFDCTGGTYTSGAGFEGTDSFSYTVTDQDGASDTANGVVAVSPGPIVIVCENEFPLRSVTTIGGGQSRTVNEAVQTTFTGHIITDAGLTSGGKNAVKLCPQTTVDFTTTSTVGTASCLVNGAATASTGTLAIGDKLICTNKPDGSDTDRFSIKSGL